MFTYTRFNERVYIDDRETRDALATLARQGMKSTADVEKVVRLCEDNAPTLVPIITSSVSLQWNKLLLALSRSSPVCGLLHPSDISLELMKKIIETDVTSDVAALNQLQRECPVLFQLIHATKSTPHKLLSPVIEKIVEKAIAPFKSSVQIDDRNETLTEDGTKTLSYFPKLPKVRKRGFYVADKSNKGSICTKKSSRHPTLHPGTFTLYCVHGMLHDCTLISYYCVNCKHRSLLWI